MKKLLSCVAVVVCVVLLMSSFVSAEEGALTPAFGVDPVTEPESLTEDVVTMDFSLDYFGKYLLRGMNLVDDPVVQPGFSATYRNFTAGFWGNFDLTNRNGNSGDFSETDLFVEYSAPLSGFDIASYTFGVIYYDFPGCDIPDTTEVYWGISLDMFLNPSVTVYHDVDEADGAYAQFGISHTIEDVLEITNDVSADLDLGLTYGIGSSHYNSYYWGLHENRASDLGLTVALPIELSNSWILRPNASYVTIVNDDMRSTDMYDRSSDYTFFGLSISKSF